MSQISSADFGAGDTLDSGFVLVPSTLTAGEAPSVGVGMIHPTLTPNATVNLLPGIESSFEFVQAPEVNTVMSNPPAAVPPPATQGSKKRRSKKRKANSDTRTIIAESPAHAVEFTPPTMVCPKAGPASRALYSAGRDAWFWMRPVNTPDTIKPSELEAEVKADAAYQASLDFATLLHPKSNYLRCIPCLKTGITKIYSNRVGGMTTGLRDHLEKYHIASYYAKCHQEGLTDRCANLDLPDGAQPEFTRSGLVDRIVDWAVTDDQALNVIESPELRELILYCGQGTIKESDIPHRDKLATAAWAMYLLEKKKIDEDMHEARGRISLTSDLWSDINRRSFMAVTAHYIDKYGALRDHLISFRKVDGQHTGANLAQALFDVLAESDITYKVGHITLDNASNNNSLMKELAAALGARGVEFDDKENRIRCFPHILNLAVNVILNSLADAAADFRAEMRKADLPIDDETERYLQALESQPLTIVRDSIHECRSSGLRREGVRHTIVDGNRLGRFRLPSGAVYMVPLLELLRDQVTRWGSTYNMIKRYLLLYPAVAEYSHQMRNDVRIPVVSHKQYEVLQDLVTVLDVAHNAQELLSAEKTPTLSLAFPVYECIIEAWEQLCVAIPELSHSITCGISKLREYVNRTQPARVHTLAMALNPSFKMEWIREHWDASRALQAEDEVKDEMLKRQRLRSHASRASQVLNSARSAAQAQNHGYLRLLTTGSKIRRASSLLAAQTDEDHMSKISVRGPVDPSSSQQATGVVGDPRSDNLARNQAIVEEEFTRYMSGGTIPVEQMSGIELVNFWKNHQFTYPLLFQVAMDVLPVQASSVSSERVFSSSKLTCTAERSRITPENLEYLQVLKHALRRRRREVADGLASDALDFVSDFHERLSLEDN